MFFLAFDTILSISKNDYQKCIRHNDNHAVADGLAQGLGDGGGQLGGKLFHVDVRLGHVGLDAKARHVGGLFSQCSRKKTSFNLRNEDY